MATGLPTRIEPEHPAGKDPVAVQDHQALRRSRERYRRPAVGELVGHEPGDRQCGQRRFDQRADHGLETRARGDNPALERRLLALAHAFERFDRHPLALGPFAQRHRGLPLGIEADGERRAADQLLAIGRDLGHVIDSYRQPPRGGELRGGALGCRPGDQPMVAQAPDHGRGERLRQAPEGVRRQLLGQQFDQQRWIHRLAVSGVASGTSGACIGKPSRSRDSKYAWATARASVRTRPI
jgi:hypothetical protein